MSKKLFTEKELGILSKNPYVKRVSTKGITYSEEFKQIFIDQYKKGRFPREIFEDCGFDVEIIGLNRIENSASRWRTAYRKNGVLGLRDTRAGKSGRPREFTRTFVACIQRVIL